MRQPKISDQDKNRLAILAEHRVLTADQMSALGFGVVRSARRWADGMGDQGLIASSARGFRGKRGQPEKVFALTKEAVDFLKEGAILPSEVSVERVQWTSTATLEHQLSVNRFAISVQELASGPTHLDVRFLTATTPFLAPLKTGHPYVAGFAADSDLESELEWFTPDGVLSLTEPQSGKALLFFVEIDMGSEGLSTATGSQGAISEKVRRYQAYFQSNAYKRYETEWNVKFNGFRLLFVAQDRTRSSQLSRLVQSVPPNDFIWITDWVQIQARGIGGFVWNRAGNQKEDNESILGPSLGRAWLEHHRSGEIQ